MTTLRPSDPLVSGRVLRLGRYSVRVRPRDLAVCGVIVAVLLATGIAALTLGGLGLSPAETWDALWGRGEPAAIRSVQGRRLPRLLTAIGVGGSLAVSGALFQSLSRNPLGSPDFIGFTAGAATAAVIQILLFGGGMLPTAVAAIAGGLVTALLVYLLARRDKVTGGLRLVLVGVGIGAILAAITDFLMVRADIKDATVVQLWTAGSLTGRGWGHVLIITISSTVIVPTLAVLGRRISLMEMGDDTAASLGVEVERYRFATILLAVLLVGFATATAGPTSFIALAAPQIARRLLSASGIPVAASFLVGATILAAADLLAEHVDFGLRTPVGLVTSLLGGLYLIWLLARHA